MGSFKKIMTLPLSVGVGLKPEHYPFFIQNPNSLSWLEIHPENYMTPGGVNHIHLQAICENHTLSMHGVGMSLGSAEGFDISHATRLKELIDQYKPAQVSEHLAWSHGKEIFFNDLLPLPLTKESLIIVTDNINRLQDLLGRKILVENPSVYLDYFQQDYSETEFLLELTEQTGCNLLLDINNVFVSCKNTHKNPKNYLAEIPREKVGEIHLAGHTTYPLLHSDSLKEIRIDDHGSRVSNEVWSLFEFFCELHQSRFPTLIEWDTNVPPINELLEDARRAEKLLRKSNPLSG